MTTVTVDTPRLNEQQLAAVHHGDGPLLILAGAGSGKTSTLTSRVVHLITARQVPAWRVLAVTFTNKAAAEMKERIEKQLPGQELPWVATFHSTCVRILRREITALGYDSSFSIYDDNDQQRLLKTVLAELDINDSQLKPRSAAAAIDAWKNRGISADNAPQGHPATPVYRLYQQRLRQANALDFGDLLLVCVRLFTEHPDILRRYAERFLHLLVDEFQDTNAVQYQLVKQLASVHGNLCVVGDDDQSIYRWRGAVVDNILGFEHDFPGCTTIRLEQNYRSSATIIAAAAAVVANNSARKGKTLWTDNPAGEPVTLEALNDDVEEARYICRSIEKLLAQGRRRSDIALLYRTNAQSRVLEEALMAARLPYAVFGGVRFFARMEIKDILAYLRLLVNPADSVAARRIINVPARGIGATTCARIAAVEQQAGGFYPACALALEQGVIKGAPAKKVAAFTAMMKDFARAAQRLPYPQLVAEIIDTSGYRAMLESDNSSESAERLDNLEQLLAGMEEHHSNGLSLEEYLEQIALVTDLDGYDSNAARITLMTLHAAKGLEFPVVFMCGLEEGLFPSVRGGNNDEHLEEERRLCYVGMTRAKEKLYLTHARRRRIYGSYQSNPPSRFLQEIPAHLLAADTTPAAADSSGAKQHNLAALLDATAPPVPAQPAASATPQVIEVEPAPAPSTNCLTIGARVRHRRFGLGTVRRVEGSGDKQKVIVYFNQYGPKRLLSKFAALELV